MLGLSIGLLAAFLASDRRLSRNSRVCKYSARTLPPSFRGKDTEDDSLTGADSAHTNSFCLGIVKWRIEEPSNYVHTTRFDLTACGVFFEIDEVLLCAMS